MVRWGLAVALFLALALVAVSVEAHKSPVVEYGISGVWRTGYSYMPRQPVVNEPITLTMEVQHLHGEIEGDVRVVFSVYEDNSLNAWYGGERYKQTDYVLIHQANGTPISPAKFKTDFAVDKPGNYMVLVDLYEDGQYIGQDMRAVDVEKRTLGPLFTTFSVVIIGAVLFGVRRRVL
jgi:hypothetical protein